MRRRKGSRGGGARPLPGLARGHLFCSETVGWEGSRSHRARPAGREPPLGSCESLVVILEALSKLCLDGEAATHLGGEGRGEWRQGGGGQTLQYLQNPSECASAMRQRTPIAAVSHVSLHPRDAGPRGRSRLHIITQTFCCGCPGEPRRVLPVCQMCLNKSGNGLRRWESDVTPCQAKPPAPKAGPCSCEHTGGLWDMILTVG